MLYNPIDIITVTYHRPNDVNHSLQSILNHTPEPHRLTIIDNSCGALDHIFKQYTNVKIIRNSTNIGKSASFKKWYKDIIQNDSSDYFVSIDPDIEVSPNWLTKLIRSARGLQLGAIAPVLQNDENDTFERQLQRKSLTMHGKNKGFRYMWHLHTTIYYNKFTAGSLFLIDRSFYEQVGGYPGDALFGRDDGYLCCMAAKHGRFIGFTTDVVCKHLMEDNIKEYRDWKRSNLNKQNVHTGHWDQ